MERVKCRICEQRPPRRFCPRIIGDICSICCGTEREVTVDCPFDCEYLREARHREKPIAQHGEPAHSDIRVSDEFLNGNKELVFAAGRVLFLSAMEIPGSIDFDMREALEALIRSYRTRESGLVYDTRPANPLAASIQARFEQEMARLREELFQRSGVHSIRDRDVLGVLIFWRRTEEMINNQRRRGRAFLDSLRGLLPQKPSARSIIEE